MINQRRERDVVANAWEEVKKKIEFMEDKKLLSQYHRTTCVHFSHPVYRLSIWSTDYGLSTVFETDLR